MIKRRLTIRLSCQSSNFIQSRAIKNGYISLSQGNPWFIASASHYTHNHYCNITSLNQTSQNYVHIMWTTIQTSITHIDEHKLKQTTTNCLQKHWITNTKLISHIHLLVIGNIQCITWKISKTKQIWEICWEIDRYNISNK